MTKITVLAVEDDINIDQRQISEIVAELGNRAAHNLIGVALEHLALSLRDTVRAAEVGDRAQVVTHADRVSRLAWQVGLISFAGVAVDVGRCAETGNEQGLAATLARLQRIGNRSLTELWDRAAPG